MALAFDFDGYLKAGVVRGYVEVAHLRHVSRARLTQIMDLTLFAPTFSRPCSTSASWTEAEAPFPNAPSAPSPTNLTEQGNVEHCDAGCPGSV
jgi:hypothetical protein